MHMNATLASSHSSVHPEVHSTCSHAGRPYGPFDHPALGLQTYRSSGQSFNSSDRYARSQNLHGLRSAHPPAAPSLLTHPAPTPAYVAP